ncbi:DUF2637 domain-containing protein [Streptomyces anulatus]|uniref:DUF2637 domain-containing protein n=1 Tax=Streptomyces anulatus TaxID=1892 RepID=UPI0022524DAD|nr:DUF2637 domain-containing protein [Streptomyces anulatus]MCX4523854.1 DUF2637 domain-containing protein [Streptomyces anulatus]MCX4606636.1 DUF2637 domain-containing protein [Streptomyces anulatus]WSU79036.1 DUF2637 domain-containing protein [Streptomyces anulatus]WTD15273.1 DUF2637 domain-containing protein [Streptomyces anulatus]WTE08675.1 DUF2637 domain-containing protein [Streptomyces anulatus]
MAAMQLTRTHRILIGVVIAGAVLIAAIGFAGSYAAVRELAEDKGFGRFSLVFPIGIDAGICVLLALDLLLTWMRIPFPLLRQTAWLLTAATIAFNGAASWPDPLGTAMHAVIPVLFVVSVEAARHAVGRIADITADKHMEGVRLTRWLLSPVPTFKLWRRMKLWELRSYEQVIKLEQDRLIYQARLQARFGRNWRRKAPVEAMMPLRLAKYGVPLAETAPAGLAAAGIEEPILTTVERVGVEGEAPVLSIGHQRTGESGTEAERPAGAGHEALAGGLATSVPEAAPRRLEPALPDVDYLAAAEGYVAQNGHFPDAEQFGLFLAQYNVIDTSTRGPLTGTLLDPVLDELWTEHHERFIRQDQAPTSGDGSSTEPEPDGPNPGPENRAEELPGQPGGTSAWFDSGQKAPAEDAAQDRLEDVESWNGASGDTALDDARSDSSGVSAAAAAGGATADRTGEGRRVVQVRIPDGEEPDQASSSNDRDDEQPEQDVTPDQEPTPLTGAELVAARYRELPAEEASRSANSLAPQLAEGTGYTVGTVRKYLGDIKRAERQAAEAG